MKLGTFGAILSYALQIEEQTASFYKTAAQDHPDELFAGLARRAHKRVTRLERARREGVAEMILEPISGLNSDDYAVALNPEAPLAEQALALEKAAATFYRDAATKMPIREIVRLFERMAEESDESCKQLEVEIST
jgi:rubrerythrin